MKTLLLITLLTTFAFGANAGIVKNNGTIILTEKIEKKSELLPVNFTIVIFGFTIHIQGDITFNIVTGIATMNVTVTVTGNGVNLSSPMTFTGTLDQGRSTNSYVYDSRRFSPQDKEVVDVILSRITLPEDKDPKKVRIEPFPKQ